MSDQTPTEEMDDQEKNWRAMEERMKTLEAENAALRPLSIEKAVTSAGFGLDTPEGKALRALALKEENVDADKVKNLAEELGFETPAPKAELTANERAAQEFSARAADLNAVTASDGPPGTDQAIQEAEAAGDWGLSTRLKLQQFIAANQ
jgi:hypothetical protein